ncbi:MAG: hypothetical protein ACJKTH_02535 [Patescibacteria group bacterium UBA2163]
MDIEFISSTFEVIGTVLIALAALRVHHRVLHDHRISDSVSKVMRFEQKLGILGILLVLLGYALSIVF